MGSIRIVYDMEGDILDVDFRLTGERPQRGIELHPNITLWTDINHRTPVRLMLLSYSQLLEQTEVVKLLTREPLKCLLTCLDEKAFRFQVIEPKVKELAAEPMRRSASA